jgi:hypothetical protein
MGKMEEMLETMKMAGVSSKTRAGEKGGRRDVVAQVEATLSGESRWGGAPLLMLTTIRW